MTELKDGVAVVYGAENNESGNVTAPFVQNETFAWLTGIIDEPGAILVIAPTERKYRELLFLPSRDPEIERWEIERLPLGSIIERRTGIARIRRTSSLGGTVARLVENGKSMHFLGPIVAPAAPLPPELELYGKIAQRVPGASIVDSTAIMTGLRTVKEPREIDQIKLAMAATRRGHLAAMRDVRPGWTERRLKGLIESEFQAGGSQGLAYDSIVGTGRNAASLHYRGGEASIADGELILIDAAASVGGYATDVTRTYPVNGKFTQEQRAVYDIVLEAQTAVVAKLKAGMYYEDLNDIAREVIRSKGHIDDFYHGVGHFVGLNVHDLGDYSKPIPAGAIITVEPGIYAQTANYGIRIEDDFLVTADGSECLSTGIPRTVDEIESFMAKSRKG